MPTYNFQFRGWYALVALVALLGFWGLKMCTRIRAVDEGMRQAVRQELLNEYAGRGPKDVARIVAEAREGRAVEPLPDAVQRDVEFTSIAARARFGAMVTLVRAEITVDGGPPPDGQPVRYFRVERKFMEEGYMVVGASNGYSYFMELVR
jgi:hypothetical protein